MGKIIKAVAGVLVDGSHVLMASRPEGKVHAGSWEFPGGKLEDKETAVDALVRELREEINVGVDAKDCQPLTFITQEYSHGLVHLDVVLVFKWQGQPVPVEKQGLHWQDLTKVCEEKPLLITTQKILDLLYTTLVNNK